MIIYIINHICLAIICCKIIYIIIIAINHTLSFYIAERFIISVEIIYRFCTRRQKYRLDTLTCTSSNANIEILHAIYNYVEEEYADATFNVEYYVNVSDIIRDENTGYVKEIIGEKVDRQTYEKSEASLWSGEQITTLSISDYDKIYADDNLLEALAQCYLKNRM